MEDWSEFIKKHFSQDVLFVQFMNVSVEKTAKVYAKISMPIEDKHSNTYGICHGGVVAATRVLISLGNARAKGRTTKELRVPPLKIIALAVSVVSLKCSLISKPIKGTMSM